MKRLAIAAVAVVAFAGTLTATATPKQQAPSKRPVPHHCTAKAFVPFSGKVWRLIRWERGAPKKSTIKAQRRRVKCATWAQRMLMQERWKADKRAYRHHRKAKLRQRRQERAQAAYDAAVSPPGMAILEAIAACESGGDPGAVSPSGSYRGKYQFSYGTWASVGGSGDPAAAPEHEQDERAARLYRASGPAPWPVCGQ